VVKKTRQQHWYREELFARFIPVAVAGSYGGKDPVSSLQKDRLKIPL